MNVICFGGVSGNMISPHPKALKWANLFIRRGWFCYGLLPLVTVALSSEWLAASKGQGSHTFYARETRAEGKP
jgi:hypothetical protein